MAYLVLVGMLEGSYVPTWHLRCITKQWACSAMIHPHLYDSHMVVDDSNIAPPPPFSNQSHPPYPPPQALRVKLISQHRPLFQYSADEGARALRQWRKELKKKKKLKAAISAAGVVLGVQLMALLTRPIPVHNTGYVRAITLFQRTTFIARSVLLM